jgi:hypothetical protein
MHTLHVVENEEDWSVEQYGEVVFRSPGEERCFKHALETSSQLFDEGIPAAVVLNRLS